MTVLELVEFLRKSILDDIGGSNVAWKTLTENDPASTQLRWSNEELVSFLTQAEREIARRTQTLIDNTGVYDINTVVDTPDYVLGPKVLRIAEIEYDGRQLEKLQHKDLRRIYSRKTHTGYPRNYAVDVGNRKITLYPTPDDIYSIQLVVCRLPLSDFLWSTADVTVPEIPEVFHFGLLNYAAYLAYMKDEATALDPGRAAMFKALFDQDFIPTVIGQEEKKMRNRGITMEYGGL